MAQTRADGSIRRWRHTVTALPLIPHEIFWAEARQAHLRQVVGQWVLLPQELQVILPDQF